MRTVLRAASFGALRSADLDLAPGRYVVLSSEPGTLSALVVLMTGRAAPSRGQVLLDGEAPSSTPQLRARIAALFEDESLPPAATTRGALQQALSLRGESPAGAPDLLAQAGLSHLAGLDPMTLGERDLRAVALATALAHERADLLVLHEPLTTTLPSAWLLAALERHTLRGATVVVTTASSADAASVGGEWLSIELGRLRASAVPRLGAGPWQRVLVICGDASALARALQDSPLGLGLELGVEPGSLNVTGSALDVTVHAIISAARSRGIEISELVPLAPPVEALVAARAGYARGAYEAARLAAQPAATATALHAVETPAAQPPGGSP